MTVSNLFEEFVFGSLNLLQRTSFVLFLNKVVFMEQRTPSADHIFKLNLIYPAAGHIVQRRSRPVLPRRTNADDHDSRYRMSPGPSISRVCFPTNNVCVIS